ncbi:MAG: peptidase M4 family protein [Caldilineae bacterium]|nr:peptidase M4 family protein [Caldilineae bacterium]
MLRKRTLLLSLVVLSLLLALLPGAGFAGAADLGAANSAQPYQSRPSAGGPTVFVRAEIASGTDAHELASQPFAAASRFLALHQNELGLAGAANDMALDQVDVDELGLTHVRLQQQISAVPVYGGELILHFSVDGESVYAISGAYLPDIQVNTRATVTAQDALDTALQAMPGASVQEKPSLVVYSQQINPRVVGDHLAWLVTLYDQSTPARNQYVIDAHSGSVLFTLNLLMTGRSRYTYNAFHGTSLPGTLVRIEGQGPYGDADVDNAHDFAGATYDYYFNTHGRDSYDDAGAPLASTAHYGVNYANAFWNGVQMVYGDNFPVLDVAAHELTHAVTENSANLVYLNQSGALNESFSDIFGAMVDDDDWLMGEDLPIGAIRSLANPPAYGDPDHVDNYLCTSGDNGGVHTNSGIQNKAAYLLATSTSRTVAGRIFYRALTVYLTSASVFIDARDAATQAAIDLYGNGSSEHQATESAFSQVGLDPLSTGPVCDQCAVQQTTADRSLFNAAEASDTLAVAYRVRDDVLKQSPLGERYIDLYYQHGSRIASLLLRDESLRQEAASLLRQLTPGLDALAAGRGEQVQLSASVVTGLQHFLEGMSAADRGGALARMIKAEQQAIPWDSLAGVSYAEAWRMLNANASD